MGGAYRKFDADFRGGAVRRQVSDPSDGSWGDLQPGIPT
jgi:hypothetical protein